MVSHSYLISIFLIISGTEQEKKKKSVSLEKQYFLNSLYTILAFSYESIFIPK